MNYRDFFKGNILNTTSEQDYYNNNNIKLIYFDMVQKDFSGI